MIRKQRTTYACFHSMRFDASKKINMSNFRRSRIAVESNAYHNFDHFRHSRMRHGIIVSESYRSQITIVI